MGRTIAGKDLFRIRANPTLKVRLTPRCWTPTASDGTRSRGRARPFPFRSSAAAWLGMMAVVG